MNDIFVQDFPCNENNLDFLYEMPWRGLRPNMIKKASDKNFTTPLVL